VHQVIGMDVAQALDHMHEHNLQIGFAQEMILDPRMQTAPVAELVLYQHVIILRPSGVVPNHVIVLAQNSMGPNLVQGSLSARNVMII